MDDTCIISFQVGSLREAELEGNDAGKKAQGGALKLLPHGSYALIVVTIEWRALLGYLYQQTYRGQGEGQMPLSWVVVCGVTS